MNRRNFIQGLSVAAAASMLPLKCLAAEAPRVKNVVLVHGLFADGSCWSRVIAQLQAVGMKATAVQNPLTTLDDSVAETRRVLAQQDGPSVLVDTRSPA